MLPLADKQKKKYNKQKLCHICKQEFNEEFHEDRKYEKVRGHCHYTGKYLGADHIICNLRYKNPDEILVVLHNGSNYDYHFIIKELAEEFKGHFDCLGEAYSFLFTSQKSN